MATMVQRKCRCGKDFQARAADVKRGWGKFCSKSCKAVEQERRTGQYADYLSGNTATQKKARRSARKVKRSQSRGVFDLSAALDRKVWQMDHGVNVVHLDDDDDDDDYYADVV